MASKRQCDLVTDIIANELDIHPQDAIEGYCDWLRQKKINPESEAQYYDENDFCADELVKEDNYKQYIKEMNNETRI